MQPQFLQQREVTQRWRQAADELIARKGEVFEVGQIQPDVLWDDAVQSVGAEGEVTDRAEVGNGVNHRPLELVRVEPHVRHCHHT